MNTDFQSCSSCGEPLAVDEFEDGICMECRLLDEEREARDWAEAEGND